MAHATRKVAGAAIVALGVTFLAFLLTYLSPTDPATLYFASHGAVPSAEELAAKRAELGLDRPFLEQYASWLAGVFHGDLGFTYKSGRSVTTALLEALPYTLALTASAMVLTLAIALPAGIACAYRKDGLFDNVMRVVTYLLNSLPAFVVALVLLYVLGLRLRLFSVTGTRDAAGLVMPTLALALPLSGWYIRQVRSVTLEQLSLGYVDGLRSRGISERSILFKHVLRNIAVPVLTLVGLSVGSLLGGSAIVETIFGWPGVGALSVSAIAQREYQIVQGYALVMAAVYLLVNAAIDASYRLIDPRIRKGV